MTKEEIEAKIKEADKAYYSNGSSTISDYEYDALKRTLRQIDPENDLLKSLGEDHTDGFEKITRKNPLLSLEKLQANPDDESDYSQLTDWANNILKINPDAKFYVQPKVDGMSVELHYEHGELVSASTRGNGFEGDNITENLVKGHVVPTSLNTNIPNLYLRGELYISKKEFERINKNTTDGKVFANARNLCAGTVKSNTYIPDRKVSFILHGIEGSARFLKINNIAMRIATVQAMLPVESPPMEVAKTMVADSVDSLGELVAYVHKHQDDFAYDIDGAVIKVDQYNVRDNLGRTDHHPRWAVAWKYVPRPGYTEVEDIIYQIGGKTGKIVPVAVLKPVSLCGSMVSKASLANVGLMANLGVAKGSVVEVVKANEIIPHITRVISGAVYKELDEAIACPACGKEAHLVQGKNYGNANAKTGQFTLDYVCNNESCPGRIKAALRSAIGTSSLNILGIGPEICDAFVDKHPGLDAIGLVGLSVADYPDTLSKLQKDNIYKEVRNARTAPLWRWITAMQFPGIAEGTAKKLSECCKTFSSFCSKIMTDDPTLTCLSAARKETCKKILLQVPSPYDRMMKMALNPVSDNYIDEASVKPLSGLNFVVTGSFAKGRNNIEKMIPQLGGSLKSSVSKKVQYLVAGENVGATKTNKAKELGTKVITEEEFFKLIEQKTAEVQQA